MDAQGPETVNDAARRATAGAPASGDEAKAERRFFLLKAMERTNTVSDAIAMAEEMRRYVNEGEREPPERPDLIPTGEPHRPYRLAG